MSARRVILTLLILTAIVGGILWRYVAWREASQDVPILAAAAETRLDPALIKAVVWRESWFNPAVTGRAGEIGLMQIRLPVAREWATAKHLPEPPDSSLFNPATNTLIGSWYLSKLLARYQKTDNPEAFALADYNAGRSRVLQWIQGPRATNSSQFVAQIPFPGTRKYVETILKRREKYRGTLKTP